MATQSQHQGNKPGKADGGYRTANGVHVGLAGIEPATFTLSV
jgi:hypothetical protein